MSSLPSTLEDVQYEVLQGDLTKNPKLQASTIPAKDKELKTTAKKIIPAINELLKTVTTCKQSVETYATQVEDKVLAIGEQVKQTLKQEQLDAITEQMRTIENNVQTLMDEVENNLKQSNSEEMAAKITELEAQMSQLIQAQVQEQIEAALKNLTVGEGGETMKCIFHSKVALPVKGSTVAPFKYSEIQNLDQQIRLTSYSEKSSTYIHQEPVFTFKTESNNLYNTYNTPIDLRVDPETDEITLVNMTQSSYMLYFFTME